MTKRPARIILWKIRKRGMRNEKAAVGAAVRGDDLRHARSKRFAPSVFHKERPRLLRADGGVRPGRILDLLPSPDVVQKTGAEERFLVHALLRPGNVARRVCDAENVILRMRRVANVLSHAV